MANRNVLKLQGVGDLLKTLNEFTPAMENKLLAKTLRIAAEPILAQAKQNAPVSNPASHSELNSLAKNTASFGALFGATEKQIAKAQRRAVKQAIGVAKKAGDRYPGQLRDSLKLRSMKRKKGRVGVLIQTKDGDFKGDEYYAAFQEYGTSKMPGKGFIRAAYDTKKGEAEQAIERELTAAFNLLAGWLGTKA